MNILNYFGILMGAIPISIAATSLSGLTMRNYVLYMIANGIGTIFFLLVNKTMHPLTYALTVTGLINLSCILCVWIRGISISPYAIVGAIMIMVGTLLTFK